MLKFPGAWRFRTPTGCKPVPNDAVYEIFELIKRTAVQDERYQRTLERFKTLFVRSGDGVDSWSSSASLG